MEMKEENLIKGETIVEWMREILKNMKSFKKKFKNVNRYRG